MEFINIPPHSSHLAQPLDLCVLSAQKRCKAKTKLPKRFEGIDEQTRNAILVIDSLRVATITRNVVASFQTAGIMFDFEIVDGVHRLVTKVEIQKASKVCDHMNALSQATSSTNQGDDETILMDEGSDDLEEQERPPGATMDTRSNPAGLLINPTPSYQRAAAGKRLSRKTLRIPRCLGSTTSSSKN